jgi:protein TonB
MHGIEHPRAGDAAATTVKSQAYGNSIAGIAQAPTLLASAVPQYPESAREAGIEGQVTLEIVVDPAGRVSPDIKIVESIPALDAAAIDAVRKWRFAPARDRDGNPITVSIKIPLRFVLR